MNCGIVEKEGHVVVPEAKSAEGDERIERRLHPQVEIGGLDPSMGPEGPPPCRELLRWCRRLRIIVLSMVNIHHKNTLFLLLID